MLIDDISLKVAVTTYKLSQLRSALRTAKNASEAESNRYYVPDAESQTERLNNIKRYEEQVSRLTRAIRDETWIAPTQSEIYNLNNLERALTAAECHLIHAETAYRIAVASERPKVESQRKMEIEPRQKDVDRARAAFSKAIEKWNLYPLPSWPEVKAELATKYGVMGVL